MQQRDFLFFILISAGIMMGWVWLQMHFAQQAAEQKIDEQDPNKKDKSKEKKEDLPQKKPSPKLSPEQLAKLKPALFGVTTVGAIHPFEIAEMVVLGSLSQKPEPEPVTKKERKESKEPLVTVPLGGEDFYLHGELTSEGAGLQKLTLSKFDAAGWYGKPVYDDEGNPAHLDLIPKDQFQASYLMFHYPEPELRVRDKTRPRPLATLGRRIWKLESKTYTDDSHRVVFSTPGPEGAENLLIKKIYSLKPKDYHIGLAVEIEYKKDPNKKEQPPSQFRYQISGAHGLPIEGAWYTYKYREAVVGTLVGNSLWRVLERAEQIAHQAGGNIAPETETTEVAVQYGGVMTQYFASVLCVDNEQDNGLTLSDIIDGARPTLESEEEHCRLLEIKIPKKGSGEAFIEVNFLKKTGPDRIRMNLTDRAVQDIVKKEFELLDDCMVAFYQDLDGTYVVTRIRKGTLPKPFLSDVTVRMISRLIEIKPGQTVRHKYLIYNGPVKVRQLGVLSGDSVVETELIERYAETLHLETLTDYPSVERLALWSDLLIFMIKIMHWLLNFLYWLVPIEGVTIILLTVLVRGLLFPISRKQAMTSMRMQELAPELKKVQEKYKNDMQARQQAVMELYRKHKVNPAAGCLPLLLQMPVFLGLYYALQESIRFRLASFIWVRNMAAPDMLIWWGESIPFLTSPDAQVQKLIPPIIPAPYLGPFFNILPIVAVSIMMIQQKLMMPPPTDEQQAMQQKMMKYMLVVIGLVFYKVAAGLCLYFIASTLWGVLERKMLPKKKKPGEAETPRPISKQTGKGKPGRKNKGPKKKEPETKMTKMRNWVDEILKQAKKKG